MSRGACARSSGDGILRAVVALPAVFCLEFLDNTADIEAFLWNDVRQIEAQVVRESPRRFCIHYAISQPDYYSLEVCLGGCLVVSNVPQTWPWVVCSSACKARRWPLIGRPSRSLSSTTC